MSLRRPGRRNAEDLTLGAHYDLPGSSEAQAYPPPPSRSSIIGEEAPDSVVAVLQGRGVGVEVGIAAINEHTGQIVMMQIVDGPTFQRTIQHLYLHRPRVVLLPDTTTSSSKSHTSRGRMNTLVTELEKHLRVPCQAVPRRCWDPDIGLAQVQRIAIEDGSKAPTIVAIADKHYARCAVAAALEWMGAGSSTFAPGTVRVQYMALEGTLFIDVMTARNLELFKNALTRRGNNTLYQLLNRCQTPMGSRALMSNILQPPNRIDVIEARLDAVQDLRQDQVRLRSLRQALSPVAHVDVERLLGAIARESSPRGQVQHIDHRINILVQLKTFIRGVKGVVCSLQTTTTELLRHCSETLVNDDLAKVDQAITASLNEDVLCERHDNTKQKRLFAVKEEDNDILEIARATYRENCADVTRCIERLQRSYDSRIAPLSTSKGFVLSLPRSADVQLDRAFTRFEHDRHRIRFSHPDLIRCNQRLGQSEEEILMLSEGCIDRAFGSIYPFLNGIWTCIEAVGLVDVVASLAEHSLGPSLVRPTFGTNIVIRNGRHPILDKTLGAGACVPNDTFLASGVSNFQIIHGPNMSGKSTYLRQVGLLSVMAHVGCYVPADSATFAVHDALLSRLSNDDSMENSLSTFAAEMATSAMILGMASSRSLVLLDELGRGTSPQEGVGLSHAIAENHTYAENEKAFVLFATHFRDLAQTLSTEPGTVNLHLRTQGNGRMDQALGTVFTYKLADGPCEIDHYGLSLAKLASLPDSVHETGAQVANKLTELECRGRQSTATYAIASRRKTVLDVEARLDALVDLRRTIGDIVMLNRLRDLQGDTIARLRATFEAQDAAGPRSRSAESE